MTSIADAAAGDAPVHATTAARVLALLSEDEPTPLADIAETLDITIASATQTLAGLRKSGKATTGRDGWTATPAPEAPAPVNVVRLPIVGHMLAEEGERDETCTRYSICLDAFFREHSHHAARSDHARCPVDCTHRRAEDRDALLITIASRRKVVPT